MSDSRLIAFDDLPLQEIEKWASKLKNPNRTTILNSWKQCIELASSIENLWWPPGVGISGYFLNAAQWTQLLNDLQLPFVPFVPIPLPPREPVMPNNNPTAVQRTDAIAQHKFHTQCYNIAIAGINHILKLFREAGHDMFLTPVMNATTKRFNVPPIAIKQSLLARYGLLTSKQRQEMIKTLDATEYTSGPIEGTVLAINEQAEELLEEGIVIDDNKKRDILVAAVETSGQLLDGQRNYDRLPEPEKTWANAQQLFGQAYEFEQRQLSTGAAGYANQAMSHQTEAIQANTEGIAETAAIMAAMTDQSKSDRAKIDTLVATVNNLETLITKLASANTNTNTNTNRSRSGLTKKPEDLLPGGRFSNFEANGTKRYCHTHGECNHQSAQCNKRGRNHEADATFDNRKNGNNSVWTYRLQA